MTQRLQAQDEKHRQEQAATMRSLGAAQDALDRQREETNEKISKELQNQKSSHDAAMRDLQGQLCAAITQSSNHDCQRELARRGYAVIIPF